MTDFLTRLAERTLGGAKVAQPIIAPLFAPIPTLLASEPTSLSVEEVVESPAQMQKAQLPDVRTVPPHPSLVTRTDQQATYTPGQSLTDQPVSEGTPGRPQASALHVQVPTPSVFEHRHFEEEPSVTPAPLVSPSAQLSEEATLTKEQPINALSGRHVPLTKTQEQHLTVSSEEHLNASHQGNRPFTGDRSIGVNVTDEAFTSVPANSKVPTSRRVPARGTLDNPPILSQGISETSPPKSNAFLSLEEHLLVPRQGDHPLVGGRPSMSPTHNRGETRAVALEDAHAIHQQTTGSTEDTSPTPTIHVTIGRIDVRAITPPSAPPTRPKPTRSGPTLSLEDYTRQNRGGR